VESKPNPFNPFSIGPFFRTTVLAPTLDLEMQEGHTKILSEPDLMTVPGQDATFLVGGQVPVPQSAGLGQVSVTFQSYGVQLDITPTLMGNGDVATKIISEVSDLDFSNGLQANGFTVPALKTSRIATNVVTAPGESIIIGGMLRHVEQRTITEIPLLSRLPIIGRLFRDVNYQRQHTNIIFLVTPTVITR
jgi:pilus assembly protein CpaC